MCQKHQSKRETSYRDRENYEKNDILRRLLLASEKMMHSLSNHENDPSSLCEAKPSYATERGDDDGRATTFSLYLRALLSLEEQKDIFRRAGMP